MLLVLIIMPQWQFLYNLPLLSSPVSAERQSDYTKEVRITKLTAQSCQLFVDLRQFKFQYATRIGISLFPAEFRWLMKRLIRNKRSGLKQMGKRVITITKPETSAV